MDTPTNNHAFSRNWCAPDAQAELCYCLSFWAESAFTPEYLAAWEAQKELLLGQMRDAGIKGSRGKLAQLEKELKELNFNKIEKPLLSGEIASFSRTRVNALAKELCASAGVLAFTLSSGMLRLIIQMEKGDEIARISDQVIEACKESPIYRKPLVEVHRGKAAETCLASYRESSNTEPQPELASELQQQSENFHHLTVLAAEASDALQACEGRLLIDATLGGGGHSERLLSQGASVIGIDQDPIARAAASKRLADFGERFHAIAGNFRQLQELLAQEGLEAVDGILADIGVSSPQLDCAERGFSFMHDGPLDMRMNPHAPLSAQNIVNEYSERDIADILWQYGEERASRAIARRIVQQRALTPITTTKQLADIIATVLPRKGKQNPATRSFQGLRIAVNDELGALNDLMEQAVKVLRPGARLAIITFHSLEDRAVKRFFERICKEEIDRPEWPAPRPNPDYCAKHITRKPLIAGEAELSLNPRARSAKLRVIEKR